MNTIPPKDEPTHTTTNEAEAGARVGVQASVVHEANIYFVDPDSTPKRKYEVGVRFLEAGVPERAAELIGAAIASGHDDAEARFHWALAKLSRRSLRDLSKDERASLNDIVTHEWRNHDDPFSNALDVVRDLVSYRDDGSDSSIMDKKLFDLPRDTRAKIERHLDQVLSGSLKDKLWREAVERAAVERFDHDRRGRIWAYFHLKPQGPRARGPKPSQVTESELFGAYAVFTVFAIAAGYIGWLVVSSVDVVSILAYLLAIAAGYVGLGKAFTWRYRQYRIDSEDAKYFGCPSDLPSSRGFANSVSNSFEHYFATYRPKGRDHVSWLEETAGIRRWFRDEVCELYREQDTPIERVTWLIRFLARDVRTKWVNGTLYDYRERYLTDAATKVQCVLGIAVGIVCLVPVAATAIQNGLFFGVLAVIAAAIAGPFAALRWEYIETEKRREDEERIECVKNIDRRTREYVRWSEKLESTRPSESEMESWLNADLTILVDEAMRHYRLTWSDLSTTAVLQGPAEGCKRARLFSGPWRYSRYDLRLFLITKDGVREVITQLHLENAAYGEQERNNYRFDALSLVNVSGQGRGRTVNLRLNNGKPRTINITDVEEYVDDHVDPTDDLRAVRLDPAGFAHALRLLEGIAAEGKGWIDRERAQTNGQ